MNSDYNIYCDESCHLENDNQKSMVLGAIWTTFQKKNEVFSRLREIKTEHGLNASFELKWNKVSEGKYAYSIESEARKRKLQKEYDTYKNAESARQTPNGLVPPLTHG